MLSKCLKNAKKIQCFSAKIQSHQRWKNFFAPGRFSLIHPPENDTKIIPLSHLIVLCYQKKMISWKAIFTFSVIARMEMRYEEQHDCMKIFPVPELRATPLFPLSYQTINNKWVFGISSLGKIQFRFFPRKERNFVMCLTDSFCRLSPRSMISVLFCWGIFRMKTLNK